MLTLGGCDAEGAAVELGIEVEQWDGECHDAANEEGEDDDGEDNPLIKATITHLAHEVGVVVGLVLRAVF